MIRTLLCCWLLLLLFVQPLAAQDTRPRASELQTAPHPQGLELNWTMPGGTEQTLLFRRTNPTGNWTQIADLDSTHSNWVDSSYTPGAAVEYQARRIPVIGQGVLGTSYVFGGDSLPATHSYGSVVLVVEDRLANVLAPQLDTLRRDLRGEGWQTHLLTADASDPVTAVQANIVALQQQVGNVAAVYLLGNVPVPYSGDVFPDGHFDHRGAWPADVYYGAWSGNWTDTQVNVTGATRPQNHNIPGDGKFDQSTLNLAPDAAVGRVDFTNLPAFAQSDTLLLQNYLQKAHRWRTKQFSLPLRGLIEDNFGEFGGEAFAANGYRNFTALLHRDSVREEDFRPTLQSTPYLFSYGTGPGTYTSAGNIVTTNQLANDNLQTVFSFLFGSYFGDWDTENNLLRAVIAQGDYTLVSGWQGRPNWFTHGLGIGEPIGLSLLRTQFNSNTYQPTNIVARGCYIALMGDPTLRALYETPVSNLNLARDTASVPQQGSPTVEIREVTHLSWTGTPQADGYFVYRATHPDSGWTLLNNVPTPQLSLVDSNALVGEVNYYMVRAAKAQRTPSAGFLNLSTGIYDTLTVNDLDSVVFTNRSGPALHAAVELYPNPTTGRFTVRTSTPLHSLHLYTLHGKLLHTWPWRQGATQQTYAIHHLPAGVYLLQLQSSRGTLTRRVVRR